MWTLYKYVLHLIRSDDKFNRTFFFMLCYVKGMFESVTKLLCINDVPLRWAFFIYLVQVTKILEVFAQNTQKFLIND